MNRTLFKRVMVRTVAWAAAAALCGVIALAQDTAPANGQRTDGQIEMDVVHALDGSQALKNDLITAATIQGQVTLSGTVSSDASKQLAESIVKGVPGVSGVKNNLNVGNPANDPNAQGAQKMQDNSQDMADNQPAGAPPAAAPSPDYGQNGGQNNVPPAYPQNQPQDNGQAQGPGYGPAPPPPGDGQAPPPGYGQAPPPPGYGQAPPPPYRPGYAPAQPSYKFAKGPVTVPQGTLIQLRTSESVDSKRAEGGGAGSVHRHSGCNLWRRVGHSARSNCARRDCRRQERGLGHIDRQLGIGTAADVARSGRPVLPTAV